MPIDLAQFENRVFSPEEAAERLRLHPDSVRRLCRTGKIRAVHPPGSKGYFILGEELLRYLRGDPPRRSDFQEVGHG